jgi:alpha-amylase
VLDDHHFRQAGLEDHQLFGYHLSEDDGRLLRIFPGSERMRYLVPYQDPGATLHYLGEVASRNPDAVVVFADDGEKFGSWPEMHRHCYQHGWLRRFLEALRHARSWVRLCTFAQALDETPPVGRVYLPDASYREMTEWALPVSRQLAYGRMVQEMQHDHRWHSVQRFLRGGFWRNFKIKYPETQEMYARMLEVSRRVQRAEEVGNDSLTEARQELYRAQCNCGWWHGAFGGLYLPHLRNAVYHHLIAAENALIRAENRGSWVEAQVGDLNLDGLSEVCLSNDRLAAYFNPQAGGCLYELDQRATGQNLLATLSRRPESYHEAIRDMLQHGHHGSSTIHGQLHFKQGGLERQLFYDAYQRKSLIDHFYEPHLSLAELAASREKELGDFVTGRYHHQVIHHRSCSSALKTPDSIGHPSGEELERVDLVLSRCGHAAGAGVRLTKTITLHPGEDNLVARYLLEDLPRDRLLHFAVEFQFAGMAAGADDRYFYYEGRPRAGQLQTWQDLHGADRIGLVDEWLGLDASLSLSQRGDIWAFPIQTVSQSEGGIELVHQSTAVMPHWHVEADAHGRWEVTIALRLDSSRAENRLRAAG